jgi:hypothetical protein
LENEAKLRKCIDEMKKLEARKVAACKSLKNSAYEDLSDTGYPETSVENETSHKNTEEETPRNDACSGVDQAEIEKKCEEKYPRSTNLEKKSTKLEEFFEEIKQTLIADLVFCLVFIIYAWSMLQTVVEKLPCIMMEVDFFKPLKTMAEDFLKMNENIRMIYEDSR